MPNYTQTEDMQYNLFKHRYILTVDGFARKYGIQLSDVLNTEGDIDPDTLPERFLDRVSMYVYQYIYIWSQNKDEKEYIISLQKYRQPIEDAMGELAYSWLLSNTDPSVFFHEDPNKLIKLVPTVHTILMTGDCLHRGKYIMLPQDWQSTKGTDY